MSKKEEKELTEEKLIKEIKELKRKFDEEIERCQHSEIVDASKTKEVWFTVSQDLKHIQTEINNKLNKLEEIKSFYYER